VESPLDPALVIAAAAGVARIESSRRHVTLTGVLAMLSVISVALNCSFSLVNQRENLGAPPAKVAEYEHLQESINRILHRGPPPPD
jgi:hypothetical protein